MSSSSSLSSMEGLGTVFSVMSSVITSFSEGITSLLLSPGGGKLVLVIFSKTDLDVDEVSGAVNGSTLGGIWLRGAETFFSSSGTTKSDPDA